MPKDEAMPKVEHVGISPGCVGYKLPDGRSFEVDLNDDHNPPAILVRAAEMAYHHGGGTHPISDYYIRIAREEITGEVDEIARLRRELATAGNALSTARAEIEALREALERIEQAGTRKSVERVGDMYDLQGGYIDIELVSEEASIAMAALSAFKGGPGRG